MADGNLNVGKSGKDGEGTDQDGNGNNGQPGRPGNAIIGGDPRLAIAVGIGGSGGAGAPGDPDHKGKGGSGGGRTAGDPKKASDETKVAGNANSQAPLCGTSLAAAGHGGDGVTPGGQPGRGGVSNSNATPRGSDLDSRPEDRFQADGSPGGVRQGK